MRDNLPGILSFIPLWLLFTAGGMLLTPEAGLIAAALAGWFLAVLLVVPTAFVCGLLVRAALDSLELLRPPHGR